MTSKMERAMCISFLENELSSLHKFKTALIGYIMSNTKYFETADVEILSLHQNLNRSHETMMELLAKFGKTWNDEKKEKDKARQKATFGRTAFNNFFGEHVVPDSTTPAPPAPIFRPFGEPTPLSQSQRAQLFCSHSRHSVSDGETASNLINKEVPPTDGIHLF